MKIKEIRNRLGLTQSELASILGLSGHTRIVEYENGTRNPSMSIKLLLFFLDKKILTPQKLKDAKRRLTT